MSEPLVPREEARAALQARAELGPDYDDAVVDRFAAAVERRVAERLPKPTGPDSQQRTAITIVSLVLSIPMLGITAGTVGLAGVLAVCVALVLVNYFAWRR